MNNDTFLSEIYTRQPLSFFEDVPVFCSPNEYQENYEKISKDHLEQLSMTGHNPFMNQYLWDVVEDSTVKFIQKYICDKGKILDVGVGTGRLLSKLDDSYQKFGVDISSSYIREAKKQNINVSMAFVEELPYHDESFDLVVSTDVLEHVLDLNSAVREMLRVLKSNGTLVLRVPYRESLKAYINSDYKFVHLRNFDEYSLKLFFEKIMKCKVIEYETSGGLVTREHLKDFMPNIFKVGFYVAIHTLKYVNPRLWRMMADKFYPHSEINMVIKKL